MADNRKKVSTEQLTLLLDELEKDPSLLTSRNCGKNEKLMLVERWELIVNKLNTVENGALKNVRKWQQAWRDWKSNTRKKAKKAGDNCSKELNELEMRIMSLYNRKSPDMMTGGIDVSSIAEIDPLSSDCSEDEPNGPVSVYTTIRKENGKAAANDDDDVSVKRRKVELFQDDNTQKQTLILSRLTALEESRQQTESQRGRALESIAGALERQEGALESIAGALQRQADAIARLADVMERRAQRELQ